MPKYLPYIEDKNYKEFASLVAFKLENNYSISSSCESQKQFYYSLEILASNVPDYVNHLSVDQGTPPSIVFYSTSVNLVPNAPSSKLFGDFYFFNIKLTMNDFSG